MQIELTESEIQTLRFYLEKAIIDAEGYHAIGIGNQTSVNNLKSIRKKIGKKNGK